MNLLHWPLRCAASPWATASGRLTERALWRFSAWSWTAPFRCRQNAAARNSKDSASPAPASWKRIEYRLFAAPSREYSGRFFIQRRGCCKIGFSVGAATCRPLSHGITRFILAFCFERQRAAGSRPYKFSILQQSLYGQKQGKKENHRTKSVRWSWQGHKDLNCLSFMLLPVKLCIYLIFRVFSELLYTVFYP